MEECGAESGGGKSLDSDMDVEDGFYGYWEPVVRGPEDFISQSFRKLDEFRFQDGGEDGGGEETMVSLEERRTYLLDEIEELESKLSTLKESLTDTTTSPKYGPSGILYSLRDSCFSHDAGKYTYEVCPFGKASQKESSSSDTNLGQWAGMEMKEGDERGEYVLKWTGGAKCWNGPKRSATVYATCGGGEDGETRLVSADEPNVCEYEFRMESPIACDDAFAARFGLE